jgi:26S proteasome regulatory subunit T6
VDPLVSLMKVEKVPDSTYDMVGGLDKQIREIKEVRARPTLLFVLFHSPVRRTWFKRSRCR